MHLFIKCLCGSDSGGHGSYHEGSSACDVACEEYVFPDFRGLRLEEAKTDKHYIGLDYLRFSDRDHLRTYSRPL